MIYGVMMYLKERRSVYSLKINAQDLDEVRTLIKSEYSGILTDTCSASEIVGISPSASLLVCTVEALFWVVNQRCSDVIGVNAVYPGQWDLVLFLAFMYRYLEVPSLREIFKRFPGSVPREVIRDWDRIVAVESRGEHGRYEVLDLEGTTPMEKVN